MDNLKRYSVNTFGNKSQAYGRTERILKNALHVTDQKTKSDYSSESDTKDSYCSGDYVQNVSINQYIEQWLEASSKEQNENITLQNLKPLCTTDIKEDFLPQNPAQNTDNIPIIQYEPVNTDTLETCLGVGSCEETFAPALDNLQQQKINQSSSSIQKDGVKTPENDLDMDNCEQIVERAPDILQQQTVCTWSNDPRRSSEISDSKSCDSDYEYNISTESEKRPVDETNNLPTYNMSPNKTYKKTFCFFCETLVVSKHFSRHLQQRHKDKQLVKSILNVQGVQEKKNIIMMIRNKGNLKLKERTGTFIPKKCTNIFKNRANNDDFSICAKCKGHFRNTYLARHSKNCLTSDKTKNNANPHVESFLLSLDVAYRQHLQNDPLKKELLRKLRMDDIGKAVVRDPIIVQYGIHLLQTSNNLKKRSTVARNKIRECARLLIEAKKIIPIPTEGTVSSILDILKPENIDYLVESVKKVSKFSETERTYGAASYALHQGKTLKDLIDVGIYLISKKDKLIQEESLNRAEYLLSQLENLRKIIDTNWGRLLGSLALKDLNLKKARNHSKRLLPLTEDLMKLRQYCIQSAENAIVVLKSETNPIQYVILVEVTFMLLLLHNRKRVGDIQFIELTDITNPDRLDQDNEILKSLTKTERVLAQFYKKIHTIGKGSKEILVLIPRDVQKFVDYLVLDRDKYIETSNKYFFTKPSSDEWINGCHIQAKYSKDCGAKLPKLIRSSKLRKHIATMMQLMDLRENEIEQLASFMGHTFKTHKEFYRLPKDVMMIAKVSKILLKLERGELVDCKNKSMDEIELDISNVSDSSAEEEEIPKNFEIPVFSGQLHTEKNVSDTEVLKGILAPCQRRTKSPSSDLSNNSELDDNDKPSLKINKKNKPSGRQRWSSIEVNLIQKHFGKYISSGSLYPPGKDIKVFLDTFIKSKRTVAQIKSKIQSLKRTQQQ